MMTVSIWVLDISSDKPYCSKLVGTSYGVPVLFHEHKHTMRFIPPIFLLLLITVATQTAARGVYQTPMEFINEVFTYGPPKPQVIWITGELKSGTKKILGHDLQSLRIRYWGEKKRTVWILDEIGKEQPITTGIIVNNGKIESIKVLVFRESRGWEIRYPFFTDQFKGLSLTKKQRLNKQIDGISGATLSVRAIKKLTTLALYLHNQIHKASPNDIP